MAKVYDIPADKLIDNLSELLKKEGIEAPKWVPFVKTGAHAFRTPQNHDWWYTRCASLMRKIYLHGPVGIDRLRSMYGGAKPNGYGMAHHRDAGGVIIRTAVHQLEKLGYIEKVEKKGRVISRQGMQKLDRMSTEILSEMTVADPKLKRYS